MSDLDAVCFDLFGTLVTKGRGPRVYYELGRRLRPWQWRRARRLAMTEALSLRQFMGSFERLRDLDPAPYERQLEEELSRIELLPDALEALGAARAAGHGIAIVSNLAAPYRQPVDRLGLRDRVDAVVFSCDVGSLKPERAIFERALDSLGARRERTLMIGDSRRDDIVGGRRAGLRVALIDRERSRRPSHLVERARGVVVTHLCDAL